VGKHCKKKTSERRKHKIVIIGDSHGKDHASKVKYDLDNTIVAQGVIKPGADLITITKTAEEEVKILTTKDAAVVCGGSKDVGKNESMYGLRQLKDFVRKNSHTNIIQIDLTYM
jgi:hypothetical protein